MKKFLSYICILFVSFFGSAINAHAFTPKSLPIIQETDHWKLKIDTSTEQQARKDVFDVYSLAVINNAGWAYNVHVDVFRNEPKTQTKYELFTDEQDKVGRNSFRRHFPISVNANELTVVITWQDEPLIKKEDMKPKDCNGQRKHMQVFTFKN